MLIVLNAVIPIFAIIFTGYICAKAGILGPGATDALNKFVVWLALPALLFQAMAGINWREIDHPGFLAAYTGGMMLTFLVSFAHLPDAARVGGHKRLADRSIEGLNAAYANTGFIGIPLCVAAFGAGALVPSAIATILTACVLFAGAITLIELDLSETPRLASTIGRVARSLMRNPLLVAPVLGAGCAIGHAMLGVALPGPVLRFTALLAAAASPCALVTIGLFLAQSEAARDTGVILRLVTLKLLVQPAITFVLAFRVFEMPVMWAHTALVLSALPIGTGPFMLAKLYDREAAVTSRAILVSTVISVVTVSALVAVLS
ncbi:MAG: AEC family transporter [Acidocella sp.]|nr:AEC family transporter [Acidocella sp.]